MIRDLDTALTPLLTTLTHHCPERGGLDAPGGPGPHTRVDVVADVVSESAIVCSDD